ncbi:hypothetical protein ACO0OE_003058 [Hanseniaspora uvarum]|jgi:hypothetical protein
MNFQATGAPSAQENQSFISKSIETLTLLKDSPIGTLATHALFFAVGAIIVKSDAAELIVPQL